MRAAGILFVDAGAGGSGNLDGVIFPQVRLYFCANACFAAAIVCCTSCSVCVAPRKAASYCDGGKYTPLSSMPRKNFPNASVFDFDALSQSFTGPGVKNHVNIDPTRLWHNVTPASLAAVATPSTSSPLNFSSRG